jgi:hypothetical protein
MWQNFRFLGRAAAFPLALAIIVLGVEARTAPNVAPAQAEATIQHPLDLAAVRAGWVRDHGAASGRLAIALR